MYVVLLCFVLFWLYDRLLGDKIHLPTSSVLLHWSICCGINPRSWWRHQMETFSALLALYAGNSPVTCEFPSQRPVTPSFDVFFDLCLNKPLSKHSRRRWFQTHEPCAELVGWLDWMIKSFTPWTSEPHQWEVNIGLGSGSVMSGNNPLLPEPMLTVFSLVIWCH